jgi:hypothetical protein
MSVAFRSSRTIAFMATEAIDNMDRLPILKAPLWARFKDLVSNCLTNIQRQMTWFDEPWYRSSKCDPL